MVRQIGWEQGVIPIAKALRTEFGTINVYTNDTIGLTYHKLFGVFKDNDGRWNVTHIPTGMSLSHIKRLKDATQISEGLVRLKSIPWESKSRKKLNQLSKAQWARIIKVFERLGVPPPIAKEVG